MSPGNWPTVAAWRLATQTAEPVAVELARCLALGIEPEVWAGRLWQAVNPAQIAIGVQP